MFLRPDIDFSPPSPTPTAAANTTPTTNNNNNNNNAANKSSLLVYNQMKTQAIKILNVWLQDTQVVSYFLEKDLVSQLVELGLQTIDEEQPKIAVMDKRVALLNERLFEARGMVIAKNNTVVQASPIDQREEEVANLKNRLVGSFRYIDILSVRFYSNGCSS